MRKSFLLAIACLLMALPVLAQDNTQWSAYLFDSINNALIHLGTNVETQSYSLGIPTGSYIYGLSINNEGSQVAYCYNHRVDPNAEGIMKLVVRDIDQEATLFEQDLGILVGCNVTAFTGDVLALSSVYSYGFDNTVSRLWELRLIDPVTGEDIAVLDNENSAMPALEVYGQQNVPLLADVLQLSSEKVLFRAIPYMGTEGPGEMPAFEWNITAGTVSELPSPFGYYSGDYLPETGEAVFSALDESFDAAMPAGPIPQANVVKVLSPSGEVNIYQNSEHIITGTSFVNNGQAILISMSPGFDEQHPETMNIMRYVLISRDGTVTELPQEFNGATFVDSIPNGAILVYTPNPTSPEYSPTQIFVLGSDNTLTLVTEVMPDYSLGWSPPYLVWTSPSTAASDLSPFVAQS